MKCYACDQQLPVTRHGVYTEDGQLQFVGPDCFENIVATGIHGYQPRLGGPRLFGPNLQRHAIRDSQP